MGTHRVNIASGNDRVAVQAGQITGRTGRDTGTPRPASKDTGAEAGTSVNIRAGNARVGRQADTVTGDIVIRL